MATDIFDINRGTSGEMLAVVRFLIIFVEPALLVIFETRKINCNDWL